MKIDHAILIKSPQALYFSRRMKRKRALVEVDSRRIAVRKTRRSLRIRVKGSASTASNPIRSTPKTTVLRLILRNVKRGSLRPGRRGSLTLNSRRIRRRRRLKSLIMKINIDSLHSTLNPALQL
jgi:hypothetical protein